MSALSAWRQGDLPRAPAYTLANVVRVIGPGSILLGVSLGAGDWLLGPAVSVTHGPAVLWICTLSVLFQAVLNTEMARYTLATGEPVFTGFMRTRPGSRFWAWTYTLLHLAQTGWPGWALAGGSALAALLLGRSPRGEDRLAVLGLGYLIFLGAVSMVLLAHRIQRALEIAEWIMMCWMLVFLGTLAVLFVPTEVWIRVAIGFGGPLAGDGWLPPNTRWSDLDWVLLVAFAAYSGAGGTINATLTHWVRDKGFGMAGTIGAVPAVVAGQRILLAREGTIFPPTEDNLAKWREWWRFLRADLSALWTLGCLVGMGLPVLLAVQLIEPGTDMGGFGAGAVLARALSKHHGPLVWLVALFTAFWTFFSTQAGIAEGFARSVTDILWTGAGLPRRVSPGGLYYAVLGVFTVAGLLAMRVAEPLTLILIGANVAALSFAVLAAHTLLLNRTLLPRELRPPLWREAAIALGGVLFGALVVRVVTRPGVLASLLGL